MQVLTGNENHLTVTVIKKPKQLIKNLSATNGSRNN